MDDSLFVRMTAKNHKGSASDTVTQEDRRRFIAALMTTLALFTAAAGIWYISGTSYIITENRAASGWLAGDGSDAFRAMLCLRNSARGIVPYVVFAVDILVLIFAAVSRSIF